MLPNARTRLSRLLGACTTVLPDRHMPLGLGADKVLAVVDHLSTPMVGLLPHLPPPLMRGTQPGPRSAHPHMLTHVEGVLRLASDLTASGGRGRCHPRPWLDYPLPSSRVTRAERCADHPFEPRLNHF